MDAGMIAGAGFDWVSAGTGLLFESGAQILAASNAKPWHFSLGDAFDR